MPKLKLSDSMAADNPPVLRKMLRLPLSPVEREAMRFIASEADALIVEGATYLIVPAPPALLECLATFEAATEDMEANDDPVEDGDPAEDSDPAEDADPAEDGDPAELSEPDEEIVVSRDLYESSLRRFRRSGHG